MFVSGSGSSLPTELRFAREPVLVADLVRYDVFVCFCAFVIVCLCLLYCDYVIRVFEYIFEYEVRPVASCCVCSSKFGDGSLKSSHFRTSEPALAGKNPTCWRQQRSSSFTAMETSFTRSTSAEIDKNAIEGPDALTVLYHILVTPDYLMIWRCNDRTHTPKVTSQPLCLENVVWIPDSIYPKMLVGPYPKLPYHLIRRIKKL